MKAVIDEQGPATILTRHVIIPAAIIAMVASFLFYLLEVRSVFLGGSTAFKQVGLCFSAATVLIARYGRVSSGSNPVFEPGCYGAALAIATFFFMLTASGAASFLPNLLIVAAVWRFATGVTEALSLEQELDAPRRGLHVYGVERVRFEELQRKQREEKGPAWGTLWKVGRKAPDAHGNPVASVALLAALALVVFAVCEPWLLDAEPELGRRALTHVIVFLFSTAVVLAAGSAAGTLRHTVKAGGRVSPDVLPARIALAALLSVVVLSAALSLPGVRFQGDGPLRTADRPGETGSGESQSNGRQSSMRQSDATDRADPGRGTGRAPEPVPSDSGRQVLPAAGLVSLLAGLGNLLRIPLIVAVIVLALLALRGFGLSLPRRGNLLTRLRDWLKRRRPKRKPRPEPVIDPFADLGTLAALSPRDAVLAAYGRLLLALDQAGHPRPERATPYEHLGTLPRRLRGFAAPVQRLTDLYVVAAYGDGQATEEDRDGAIGALAEMRGLTSPASVPGSGDR